MNRGSRDSKFLVESKEVRENSSVVLSQSVHNSQDFFVSLLVVNVGDHGEDVHGLGADLEHVLLQGRHEDVIEVVIRAHIDFIEILSVVSDKLGKEAVVPVHVSNVDDVEGSSLGLLVAELQIGHLGAVNRQFGQVVHDPLSKAVVINHITLYFLIVSSEEAIPERLEDLGEVFDIISSHHVDLGNLVVKADALGGNEGAQEGNQKNRFHF